MPSLPLIEEHSDYEKSSTESQEDMDLYDQKFLQLDKKRGIERGRLAEHESASSEEYYPVYRKDRRRHDRRRYEDDDYLYRSTRNPYQSDYGRRSSRHP